MDPKDDGPIPRLSVFASLRGYRTAWLRDDISAGIAIASVGILSAIAYPAIAGLPPETGIYASIASVVGYADGIAICFVQGSVLFFNADHVKARLDDIIDKSPDGLRWVVIDASAITQVDTTAAAMLLDIRTRLRRRGFVMVLAEVQSSVAAFLGRAGLSPQEGDLQFFDDLDDAFHAFEATGSKPREGQA